jgi:shikimate kinase
VGRALAVRLGWHFADLDESIEAREGLTVPQIFAEQGEPAFRAAETAALTELLEQEHLIIALGGGALGTPVVCDLLAHTPGTRVVHLDAPFPVLYERCAAQAMDANATARPLLGDRSAAEERYRQRRGLYQAVAHATAPADAGAPELVADCILRALTGIADSSR